MANCDECGIHCSLTPDVPAAGALQALKERSAISVKICAHISGTRTNSEGRGKKSYSQCQEVPSGFRAGLNTKILSISFLPSFSIRVCPSLDFFGDGRPVLETLGFESESQLIS
jgi:hypothetical protein